MASLRNTLQYKNGTGYAAVYFTTKYDVETNRTTVTFTGFGYQKGTITEGLHHIYASISVKAADNQDSIGTASTNGDTPTPNTITVQHDPAGGSKSVIVTMFVNAQIGDTFVKSTNSAYVTTGVRPGIAYIDNGSYAERYESYIDDGTKHTLYAPYIDTGSGWVAN